MVDVVYILGKGSKWDDNELKYSIRSVIKHLKNYGTIWIVGAEPRCELDAPVRFIPSEAKARHKNANIRASLKRIAQEPECSEEFIYMNDDFFFVKDVDASTIPFYYWASLGVHSSHFNKVHYNDYWRTIVYTWGVMQALGLGTKDFELHVPMRMEKAKLIKALEYPGTDSTLQIRSIYGNLYAGEGEILRDCKIGTPQTKVKIKEILDKRTCFSIGDEGINDDMKELFEELYPATGKVFKPEMIPSEVEALKESYTYYI